MINKLIKLSNELDGLGHDKWASYIDSIIKVVADDNESLQSQLPFDQKYFKKIKEFTRQDKVDKYKKYIDGFSRFNKETEMMDYIPPNPLRLLDSDWKGRWYNDQLEVYDELREYALDVLLYKRIKTPNEGVMRAPYFYFVIKTPNDQNLYQDKKLSQRENEAAQLTAEHNPHEFLNSFYLTNNHSNLLDDVKSSIMEAEIMETKDLNEVRVMEDRFEEEHQEEPAEE